MTSCYLDASALVKLLTDEAETAALRAHLATFTSRSTSRLTTVEVPRALARKGVASVAAAADAWQRTIQGLVVIELERRIGDAAAAVDPATLRSLDAIHLATALSLRGELDAFVTYDPRLAEAARAAGLTVVAPGSILEIEADRGRLIGHKTAGRDVVDELYGSMPLDEPVDDYLERTRGR